MNHSLRSEIVLNESYLEKWDCAKWIIPWEARSCWMNHTSRSEIVLNKSYLEKRDRVEWIIPWKARLCWMNHTLRSEIVLNESYLEKRDRVEWIIPWEARSCWINHTLRSEIMLNVVELVTQCLAQRLWLMQLTLHLVTLHLQLTDGRRQWLYLSPITIATCSIQQQNYCINTQQKTRVQVHSYLSSIPLCNFY